MSRISRYQPKKPSAINAWRRRWRLVLGLVLLAGIGAEGFYAIFFSPLFKVRRLEVKGPEPLAAGFKTALNDFMRQSWLNFLPQDTTWFINENQLSALASSVSAKFYINGSAFNWSNKTLTVNLATRQEVAIWCAVNGGCAYVDSKALALGTAPQSTGSVLPIFRDATLAATPVAGQTVADPAVLDFMLALRHDLNDSQYSIRGILRRASNDLVVTVEPGFEAYFTFDDSPQIQVQRLTDVLKSLGRAEWAQLKYVDLRAGRKVFYQKQEVVE